MKIFHSLVLLFGSPIWTWKPSIKVLKKGQTK